MSIQKPIEHLSPVEFERELGNQPLVRNWLESYGWTGPYQFGGRGLWRHKHFSAPTVLRNDTPYSTTAALHLCRAIPVEAMPDKRRGVRHDDPGDSDSETHQPERWIPSSRFLPPVLEFITL